MTNKEHLESHILLHKNLDILLAVYICDTGKLLSNTSCMELLEWSSRQIDKFEEERQIRLKSL